MNGVIVIDKDENMTSFDVVAKMRKICKTKKVGHTGTLDPDATGVLPVCIGNATRAADIMTGADKKRYRALMRLGSATDTFDASGKVTLTGDASIIKDGAIESAGEAFRGEIMQVPPMYSAIKHGGKKLYQLAREGKTVELEPRSVKIHSLEILGRNGNDVTLDIICSKGTYIRSLCNDIGEKLGCFAHMAALRRTASGNFTENEAVKLSELNEENAENYLVPTDRLFDYPEFKATGKQEYLIKNGVAAYCEGEEGLYRVYSESGKFLSVSEIVVIDGKNCLKLVKSFWGEGK